MKCELCHKAEASEVLFRNGNEEDELYVCSECAKAERMRESKDRLSTRKGQGADAPQKIIGAIVDAVKEFVGDMEMAVREVKISREQKLDDVKEMTAEGLSDDFAIAERFHLEGLHLIGEIGAVKRAFHALEMELKGVTADGVNDSGHVYTILYRGDPNRVREVAEDLIRQERNARIRLREECRRIFADSVCRALAILKNCRLLSSGEFFDLLSPLCLAAREKMLEGITIGSIRKLMLKQDLENSEDALPQDERDRVDAERADRVNRLFEKVMLDEFL